MMKKIIRGTVLLAFCFMVSVMSVKAADDSVTLTAESDGVKVMLSKEAVDDEVHSLHLSLEVDVTKGNLSKNEVTFDWKDIPGDAYKTQFCEEKDGKMILDIYASAKQDLFPAESDKLTLGVVKLAPATGSVTATVAVAGDVETVNGIQEMNKVEGLENTSVEVTAGTDSGGKKPSGSSPNKGGSNSGSGGSSGAAADSNQTVDNSNNTNNVNTGLNKNTVVPVVPDSNNVKDTAKSRNNKSSSSGKKNVQVENLSDNQSDTSDTESVITDTEDLESEETESASQPESEVVSTKGVSDENVYSEVDESLLETDITDDSSMGLVMKIFLGIIIGVVVAAGAVFAIRVSNKKNDN